MTDCIYKTPELAIYVKGKLIYLVFGGFLETGQPGGLVGGGRTYSRWPQGKIGPLEIPSLHPRKLQRRLKTWIFTYFL